VELNDKTLSKLARRRRRVTVLLDEPHYVPTTTFKGRWIQQFPIFVRRDPQDFHVTDFGTIYTDTGFPTMLFLDVLNKFGSRYCFTCAKGTEVAWRITPSIVVTAFILLRENAEQLEEITQKAKTPKEFLALAAIV